MNKPILIIISFSLAAILAVVLVLPKYQDLQFLNQEIEQKNSEIHHKEEYIEQLKNIKKELELYPSQLAKLNSALPADPAIDVLLNFIQRTVSQSGLVLKEIDPPITKLMEEEETLEEITGGGETLEQIPVEKSKLKWTDLTFTVSGQYSALKNLLYTLENSARLIEVKKVSFSPPEKDFQNFEIQIRTYSY